MLARMKDYYQILGLSETATADEIKKTYRRLAKQYHPDINKKKEAEEKFKEISEAYNVLSDPKQRQQFDRFRQAGMRGGPGWAPGSQQWEYKDFSEGMGGNYGNLGDLFGELFQMGGMRRPGQRGGFGQTPQEPRKGSDTYADVDIDFLEAVHGTSSRIRIQRGRRPEELTVKVPAGVDNGSKVRLAGKGELGEFGGETGDFYLRIHVRPHPLFWRESADIYCEVPITFYEAALGASIDVPTLEGHARMKIPEGTASGQKFRLKGKGAPILGKSGRGDQYVVVQITPPKKLTKEAKEWLEEWSEKHPYNPRES